MHGSLRQRGPTAGSCASEVACRVGGRWRRRSGSCSTSGREGVAGVGADHRQANRKPLGKDGRMDPSDQTAYGRRHARRVPKTRTGAETGCGVAHWKCVQSLRCAPPCWTRATSRGDWLHRCGQVDAPILQSLGRNATVRPDDCLISTGLPHQPNPADRFIPLRFRDEGFRHDPDDLPIFERDVVRIVLRDSADRILLFHTHELTASELGQWWELSGGVGTATP
jgi:hypothetical protein